MSVRAIAMLRSNKRDENLLGIQNLVCLTDPVKTSTVVAGEVAKKVIVCDDVREEIRALIEHDIFSPEEEEGLLHHADMMRHNALIVFANALAMCQRSGCLAEAVKSQRWFCDCLIPSILDELKRAETCAINAYQAACCISSLVDCSDVSRKSIMENGGIGLLELAVQFGCSRHELLASESRLCLDRLKN
jgi:hypothetical protein